MVKHDISINPEFIQSILEGVNRISASLVLSIFLVALSVIIMAKCFVFKRFVNIFVTAFSYSYNYSFVKNFSQNFVSCYDNFTRCVILKLYLLFLCLDIR